MADVREYYQTTSISWLNRKEKWKGIKSIGIVDRTFDGVNNKRYYISSLLCNTEDFSKAVRGDWLVESMYWQLDITFHEDADYTLDKTVAANMNIIRKRCLFMLKHVPFINKISRFLRKFLSYLLSLLNTLIM